MRYLLTAEIQFQPEEQNDQEQFGWHAGQAGRGIGLDSLLYSGLVPAALSTTASAESCFDSEPSPAMSRTKDSTSSFPLIDRVEILDIKTKKSEVDADASTKDLQMVTSKVALNYHINPNGIAQFFQKFGNNFESNVLDPGLQEILKAVTARYTAEEVITKREQVREDTNALLKERFLPQGMVIDGLNIVNFHFSKVFNDAIEAKVTAEQNALAAKNKLEQVKFEAQQMVEAANGKAKAIQVEASAIANNPLVLQLRALEKWNGILPQYVGSGSIPFIQIK